MSYRISGHSKAYGIDAESVKAAFRDFVHALDRATLQAGDDGTKVELELVFSDWQGDDASGDPERVTADDVRRGD